MDSFTLDKLPKNVLAKIDMQTAFMASRCVLAAERLQLFRKLHRKELSSAQIARDCGLNRKHRDFFLSTLAALGLLKKKKDRYSNSALADRYFVKERSIYWTRAFSEECVLEFKAFSVLDEVLTTGNSYETILGIKREDYVQRMQNDPKWASDFTNMLYYHHQPEAKALAAKLDLSGCQRLLDVGGGSGVTSMALVKKYPDLKACVLDIEPVCKVARKIIQKEGFARKIDVIVGDFNRSLPTGFDVIMLSDVGGTTPDLLGRIYNALPVGGRVVLADFFSSEDWSEPLLRLMWQLRSESPRLVTRQEATDMVRDCRFKSVQRQKVVGNTWMITGRKL